MNALGYATMGIMPFAGIRWWAMLAFAALGASQVAAAHYSVYCRRRLRELGE